MLTVPEKGNPLGSPESDPKGTSISKLASDSEMICDAFKLIGGVVYAKKSSP